MLTHQLPLLTNSRAKAYRTCARYHHYTYNLQYRPATQSEVFRFGTLVHAGLEAWFIAAMEGQDRLPRALAAIAASTESDAFEKAKAEAIMCGYHFRWVNEDMKVLAVEREFTAPLINPETGSSSKTFMVAGKIDAIVEIDGRAYVVEHKTSSEDISAGTQYWKRLRMDSQVSTYLAGAKAIGFDVSGCIYDVLGKPAVRPYKATSQDARKYTKDGRLYANQRAEDETVEEYKVRVAETVTAEPEKYFVRAEVVRLDDDALDAEFDNWQIAKSIRDAQVNNRHPRNPEACLRYGRECEFFGVCTRESSLEDPLRFKRNETAHPELEKQDAA